MKQQIISFFIILTFLSCNREIEKIVSIYENGQPEWVVQYNSTSDTTFKTITGYFEDGTKKCIRNLRYGRENGEQIVFFPNGQIKTLCTKQNGKQTGFSKIYFENGNLYAQGYYEKDYRQGQWELWDKNGTKFIRNYRNDTLYGNTSEFRPDGAQVYGQYNQGLEIGEWTTKSSEGIVTIITTYKQGTLHGPAKEYYQTGELYVSGYFINGDKHGEWKIYSKAGRLDTVEIYRKDKLIKYELAVPNNGEQQ